MFEAPSLWKTTFCKHLVQTFGLMPLVSVFPLQQERGWGYHPNISTLWLLGDVRLISSIFFAESTNPHGSLNVPIEHHPTIRYMVYNGYYKVMSNSPKMGHLPIPDPTTAELGEADSVLSCRMAQYSTLRCEGFSLHSWAVAPFRYKKRWIFPI